MHYFDWHHAAQLALLLGAAILAGKVAARLHLPKVTAYLLVGMILGPSVLDVLHEDSVHSFEPFVRLATALVLFHLGSHLPFSQARKIFRRVAKLSAGELLATFLLVTCGMLLLGMPWQGAILLGAIAMATAPATTILVLREVESEGRVTQFNNAMVANNNLVAIVVFEILLLVVIFFFRDPSAGPTDWGLLGSNLGTFGMQLLGALAVGVIGGALISFSFVLVAAEKRLVALVAILVGGLAVCLIYDFPYLLAFLTMGVMVANTSDRSAKISEELDHITILLCVVFFVGHGAELKPAKMVEAGVFGVGYLAFRTAGKYFGTSLTARWTREDVVLQKHLGGTLLAHGSTGIVLAGMVASRTAEVGGALGDVFETVEVAVVGAIAVFEIFGPIAIQRSVLQAGEVPLANAIRHTSGPTVYEAARGVVRRFAMAMGRDSWFRRNVAGLKVQDLMRGSVEPILETENFDQVLHVIEHSHVNTCPVVNDRGGLVGVIRYPELSSAMFSRNLGILVLADDMAAPTKSVLHPEQTVEDAYAVFHECEDDCLPVVNDDEHKTYLGIVLRRDVIRRLIRESRSSGRNRSAAARRDA